MASKEQSREKSFFESYPKPKDYADNISNMEKFVSDSINADRPIALITSGGTTIPLESRTVRFIDNFSLGNRGATSAEYFLSQGYSVIFLHRHRTMTPYARRLAACPLLDFFSLDGATDKATVMVSPEHSARLANVLEEYQQVKKNGTLLQVEFVSLGDYLHLLRGACGVMQGAGARALLYLAAAVSDFYITAEDMPEHKIQSSDGSLKLTLDLVPKMLIPLVRDWVPNAYVISFKLETNEAILLRKCRRALETYRHKVVIGNILETRRHRVVIVTPEAEPQDIVIGQDDSRDIEELIVGDLAKRHAVFMDVAS